MGFAEQTFDMRKFARALGGHQGAPGQSAGNDALGPDGLNPRLHGAYIQALRHGTIDIGRLDFGGIGEGDIDDLESVLENSPANGLFKLGDAFRMLEPSAAAGRAFI